MTDEQFQAYMAKLRQVKFSGNDTYFDGIQPGTLDEWHEAYRDLYRAACLRIRELEEELKKARA